LIVRDPTKNQKPKTTNLLANLELFFHSAV